MQPQHDALLAPNLFLLIRVGQERQQRPVHAGRGLDDVGHHVGLAVLVEVGQRLAAELGVLFEVEVGAVGDAHQLAPADGEAVLDVGRALGVVGQLVLVVLAQPQIFLPQAVAPEPAHAVLDPALVPVLVRRPPGHRIIRIDEVLDLHLLELARPEDEVARRDLVAEGLADLGDAEGQLAPHGLQHVVEVDEDSLGRLGPEVGDGGVLLHRSHEGPEHQVELARGRQLALAALGAERAAGPAVAAGLCRGNRKLIALGLRAVVGPGLLVNRVGAEAPAALAAVHHGVGEVVHVAAGLPHGRVHEDGGVQPHHVGALLDEVPPPDALDLVLQLHAERAVVPARARAAVDLARLEDEAAALAERDEGFHRDGHGSQDSTVRRAGPTAEARRRAAGRGGSGRGSGRPAAIAP